MPLATSSDTERVREWLLQRIILPARVRGDRIVSVTAGEVHKQLGFQNRVPLVCQALRSKRLLEENHLVLKDISGPPSKQSTTVRFTYEIASGNIPTSVERNPLWDLSGIAKGLFQELGGGEAFIRSEREQLSAAIGNDWAPEQNGEGAFTQIWQSVVAHTGENFSTIKGRLFRYLLAGQTVRIERNGRLVEQALARSEFRKAWERWPVSGPGELQDLRGPAYIFAILSDARIWKDAGY
jgi:hypothetical protein